MIILAAGQGTRLRPLTDSRPKCLVELGGKTLLDWQLDAARETGIDDVVVVGGYLGDQLRRPGLRVVLNPDHDSTNMVASLFCAEVFFGEGFVLSYGDIVYGAAVLETLLATPAPVSVAVDRDWRRYWEMRFSNPLSDAESLSIDVNGNIQSIGQPEGDIARIEAQYIGLLAFRGTGVGALRRAYAVAQAADRAGQPPFNSSRSLAKLFMTDLLQGMIDLGYPLTAVPIIGGWVEIDSFSDLKLAEELIAQGRLKRPAQ